MWWYVQQTVRLKRFVVYLVNNGGRSRETKRLEIVRNLSQDALRSKLATCCPKLENTKQGFKICTTKFDYWK